MQPDVPVQSPLQWTCWADEASGSQRFLALVARLKLTKCRLLLARRATRIADALATPARREMSLVPIAAEYQLYLARLGSVG